MDFYNSVDTTVQKNNNNKVMESVHRYEDERSQPGGRVYLNSGELIPAMAAEVLWFLTHDSYFLNEKVADEQMNNIYMLFYFSFRT